MGTPGIPGDPVSETHFSCSITQLIHLHFRVELASKVIQGLRGKRVFM